MVDIKEVIKKRGATLTHDLEVTKIKKGYFVSLLGFEKKFDCEDIKNINDYILKLQKKIENKEDYFIGLWIYKREIYVDISINILDKAEALEFGKKNKQLAIYEVLTGANISLKNYKFITYYTLYKLLDNGDYQILKQTEQLETMREYLANYNINYSYKVLTNKCCLSIEDKKNIGSDGRLKIVKDYEVVNCE